jgi:hypothetical protein
MLTSDDIAYDDAAAVCEAPETSTWRSGPDANGRNKA